MKIFQANIYLDKKGGAENSMWELAEALASRGHEMGFIYHHKPSNLRQTLIFPAFRVPVLEAQVWPNPWRLSQLAIILKRERPDILLLHNVYNIWVIALLAKILPTVRYVRSHETYCIARRKTYTGFSEPCNLAHSYECIVRCCQNLSYPLRLILYIYRKAEILLTKRLNRLFVASEYMKRNLLINGFSEKKITVMPPYAKSIRTTPAQEANPIALFVGKLEVNKGGALLLNLASRLPPGTRLDVVGDGTLKEIFLKELESLGLRDRVAYRGWLTGEEVRRAYDNARVVIFPSLWEEPFGRIGIEAMAAGKPVVAFEVGGVSDWLQSGVNGFLVPRGDVTSLAEKAVQLLNNEELSLRMGEAGRIRAVKLFNRDGIIEKFEKALKACRR